MNKSDSYLFQFFGTCFGSFHFFVMDLKDAEFDFSYDDGEEFSYKIGNRTVRGRIWRPPLKNDKHLTLIHVHGLGDWVTRNKDIFKVFNDRGFTVIASDHLGHGRSDGIRCDTSVYEIAEETISNIELSKTRFPLNKIFIWGHSLGGLSVLYASFFRKYVITEKVKGIICESPWLTTTDKKNPITLWESVFLYLCNFIKPALQIPCGMSENKAEMPEKFNQLTKDAPENNVDYLTPNLLVSVFQAITDVRSMSSAWPKGVKLFLAFGKKDEMLSIEELMPYYNDMLTLSSKGDVTIQLYDGYHALTKCNARKDLFTDVFEFIDNILQERSN